MYKKVLVGLVFWYSFFAIGKDITSPKIELLTEQNDVIWGFDFLDSDRIIFSERKGQLKLLNIKSKKVEQVKGTPPVWANGQGGLLDVRVHYKDKTKIYFTYSEPVGSSKATTSLGMGIFKNNELTQFKRLFQSNAESSNEIHFGSRIEFDQKGHLYMTIGDRNDRPRVQDLKYHNGKIIRLNEDGTKAEIWSLGHRSPQGLVYDPIQNNLWMAEMGARGGDEVNLVLQGKNYGWPIITHGKEYSGLKVGDGIKEKVGMEQPIVYWSPSISPSGLTIYNSDQLKSWKGNLFLGCLSGQQIRRLVLKDNKVTEQEALLENMKERFRNVRSGPDGYLYFSTDSGKIFRITSSQ